MKIYVVTENYSDYDEGHSSVVSIHFTPEGAVAAMGYADWACELEYAWAESLKYARDAPFLWGTYHNYSYCVEDYEVMI